MNYQSLTLCLNLYHERPESVQEVFQSFSLPLFYPEEIERDRWSFSVDYELFLEQRKELVERGDVVVWRPMNRYSAVPVNVPMKNL